MLISILIEECRELTKLNLFKTENKFVYKISLCLTEEYFFVEEERDKTVTPKSTSNGYSSELYS